MSEPGRPKADDDGAAFAAEALIGDAELDLESCISWSRFVPKPNGINGWLLPCNPTTIHSPQNTAVKFIAITNIKLLNNMFIIITRKKVMWYLFSKVKAHYTIHNKNLYTNYHTNKFVLRLWKCYCIIVHIPDSFPKGQSGRPDAQPWQSIDGIQSTHTLTYKLVKLMHTKKNKKNTTTKHTWGRWTCWACGGTSSAPRSITAKSGAAAPAFGGTCGGKTSGRTPECCTRGRGTGEDLFSDSGVSDGAGLTFWLSTSVRYTYSSSSIKCYRLTSCPTAFNLHVFHLSTD